MNDFGPVLERIAIALEKIAAGQNRSGVAKPVSSSPGGAVFPPFGKRRGEPIRGAAVNDLRFYAHAAVRSLSDPAKERWHEQERARLDAINAELRVQGEPTVGDDEFEDDFGPPPTKYDARPGGDDIPF